jgi:hypothetical protein
MTETVKFVDGVSYTEADQADWNMAVERPGGIFADSILGILSASAPGGMTVRVSPGNAMIRGFLYKNDANKDLTIGANVSGSLRIDTVVLRLVPTSNICTAQVIAGTPGAGAPTLTQVPGGTWDFPLADVSVANGAVSIVAGNLSDRRTYSKWPANALDDALATDADIATVSTSISNEITNRTAADTAEATARTNADNTEISARSSAISSEAATRSGADSTEAAARLSGDNALNTRMLVLEGFQFVGYAVVNGLTGAAYSSYGIFSTSRTGVGTYRMTLPYARPSTNYGVIVSPRGLTGARATYDIVSTTIFDIHVVTYASGQTAIDLDFAFVVLGG